MRHLFCIASMLILVSSARGQSNPVPNPSFEEWTTVPLFGSYPTDWFGDPTTISQSTDAHSGTFAVAGAVIPSGDTTLAPSLLSWNVDLSNLSYNPGFPINSRPTSLEGYFKFTSVQNDAMFIYALIWNSQDSTIAESFFVDSIGTDGYFHFSVPLTYFSFDAPDSGLIGVSIYNTQGYPHVGSSFVLDDFALTNPASVSHNANVAGLELKQNYPNPFNRSTTIRYTLPHEGRIMLQVLNMLGERVALLKNGSETEGAHDIMFDASNLPSGPYLCRLTTDSGEASIRIIQVVH